jgi:hypothetical protein
MKSPLPNPLPSRRIEQLAANPGGDTPRGCEGEGAMVKGACFDLVQIKGLAKFYQRFGDEWG